MNFSKLAFLLLCGASAAGAATITVGPHGQYPSPCAAFQHVADGDTVKVDANQGTPYYEGNCIISKSNLTISGVSGRPILDGGKTAVKRGIWLVDGHDIAIDNFEFRNARPATHTGTHGNAAGLWIRNGTAEAPNGGNITVSRCYIHDNGDGIISSNVHVKRQLAPGAKPPKEYAWYSKNPYITFEYDDFDHNGDGTGQTHNIYIGFGGNLKFTLRYSVSRDAFIGHDVKTRAPYNDILQNRISDQAGATSYLLDFPVGGSTNVIGNLLYRAALINPNGNDDLMVYRDVHDESPPGPDYGPPHQDLHFLHNVVIDNNPSESNAYVIVSCRFPSSADCPKPKYADRLTTHAVVEGNLLAGRPQHVTNQPGAIVKNNVVLPYNAEQAGWINGALQSIWPARPYGYGWVVWPG
jgi:hypothetical protein